MCFKNLAKFLGKNIGLSKLQAYKLQPLALRVFKIQKIYKITSTVAFFFVEAGANSFTTE